MGARPLSEAEEQQLTAQRRRPVQPAAAARLELQAGRHWDLFYRRNGANFFKDRHWTTREFLELLPDGRRTLLELGCGAGNLLFPLLEARPDYSALACDLSPRAVDLVRSHPQYDPERVRAFQADVTGSDLQTHVSPASVDVAALIFVLSAIHPDKFRNCLDNVREVLKPGGVVLFRDYGLYDMTQLRFKPGHLISENFYMRQDGTRSYFFELNELSQLFIDAGFEVLTNEYVERRTVNKKEQIDVPRTFLQGKFKKPD